MTGWLAFFVIYSTFTTFALMGVMLATYERRYPSERRTDLHADDYAKAWDADTEAAIAEAVRMGSLTPTHDGIAQATFRRQLRAVPEQRGGER